MPKTIAPDVYLAQAGAADLAEAGSSRLPVRLRVLAVNPARELYARLGFVVTSSTPERLFMEHP